PFRQTSTDEWRDTTQHGISSNSGGGSADTAISPPGVTCRDFRSQPFLHVIT
ncbi:MAG: hypothetical protein ACI9PP_001609, partial [Halobacteriales archaeon]